MDVKAEYKYFPCISMADFDHDTALMTHFRADGAQARLQMNIRGCGMMGDTWHVLVQIPRGDGFAAYWYETMPWPAQENAEKWFAENGFVARTNGV